MTRLAVWTVVGLLLGLVVHLATLLALPMLARENAAARLDRIGSAGTFQLLPMPAPGASILPSPDPFMRLAICRYDLSGGPVHLRAPVTPGFFAASFYTREGLNYYALTDRAAANGVIELTVYSNLQLAEVRSREGPDTPESLRVEAPADGGFIVLRALMPEESFADLVEGTLDKASCTPAPPDLSTDAPDASTDAPTQ